MKPEELYSEVLNSLNIDKIHPLHKEILLECCENVLATKNQSLDLKTLKDSVTVAFLATSSSLKGTLNGALKIGNANVVSINYREKTFEIERGSNFLR
jgi:hypothetical protein